MQPILWAILLFLCVERSGDESLSVVTLMLLPCRLMKQFPSSFSNMGWIPILVTLRSMLRGSLLSHGTTSISTTYFWTKPPWAESRHFSVKIWVVKFEFPFFNSLRWNPSLITWAPKFLMLPFYLKGSLCQKWMYIRNIVRCFGKIILDPASY